MTDLHGDIATDSHDELGNDGSLDAAAKMLLKRWEPKDAETPSDDTIEQDTDEQTEAETADEVEASDGNTPDIDEDNEPVTASDDDDVEDDRTVSVKVNGKIQKTKVRDLKRLYGREQALSSKETEVATLRKQIEAEATRVSTAAQGLLKRAQERYQPYSTLDWNLLATQMDAESYTAIKNEALKAYNDMVYLHSEVEKDVAEKQKAADEARKAQADRFQAKAHETSQILEKEIPNFPKVYRDIVNHMTGRGVSKEVLSTLIEPEYIRILHDAYLYRLGKQAASNTKAINKAPTKVIKSTRNAEVSRNAIKPAKHTESMARLKRTGSVDDATAALLARWEKNN